METSVVNMVRENIKNAIENDYDCGDYTDEELAGDLHAYAADLENKTFESILQAVKIVRAEGIGCQRK